jgi:hypothetical protein
VRDAEYPLEKAVSDYIREMPFLWLAVEDDPGPDSLRGSIERNSISLLSNLRYPEERIDPPSERWLGKWAATPAIKKSGLWNVNHTEDERDGDYLLQLKRLITNLG